MQPGQGAWGTSLWFHYGRSFNQRADWIFFTDVSLSNTKENDREYSFQGEQNLTAGFSYSTATDWNASVAINYRNAESHTRFGGKIPNTGGKWIDFVPSIQYVINEQMNLSIAARVPLKRDLNGSLQFTTKQSFSLSFNYLIK